MFMSLSRYMKYENRVRIGIVDAYKNVYLGL